MSDDEWKSLLGGEDEETPAPSAPQPIVPVSPLMPVAPPVSGNSGGAFLAPPPGSQTTLPSLAPPLVPAPAVMPNLAAPRPSVPGTPVPLDEISDAESGPMDWRGDVALPAGDAPTSADSTSARRPPDSFAAPAPVVLPDETPSPSASSSMSAAAAAAEAIASRVGNLEPAASGSGVIPESGFIAAPPRDEANPEGADPEAAGEKAAETPKTPKSQPQPEPEPAVMDEDAFAALAAASMVGGRRPSAARSRPSEPAAPPPSVESSAPAVSGGAEAATPVAAAASGAAAIPKAAAPKVAAVSVPATSEPKSKTGMWIGLAAVAAIGVGVFFVTRGGDTVEPVVTKSQPATGAAKPAAPDSPVDAQPEIDDAEDPGSDSGELALDGDGMNETPGSEATETGGDDELPPDPTGHTGKGARHYLGLAEAALAAGDYSSALAHALRSDAKHRNKSAALIAGIAACNTSNEPTARRFWNRLGGPDRAEVESACQGKGITLGEAAVAEPDPAADTGDVAAETGGDPAPAGDGGVDPAAAPGTETGGDPAATPAADSGADPAAAPAADSGADPAPPEPTPTDPTPAPEPEPTGDPEPETSGPSADELMAGARQAALSGAAAKAYDLANQAHKAGGGSDALVLMGVSACQMGSASKAKAALVKLSASKQDRVRKVCEQRGVALD